MSESKHRIDSIGDGSDHHYVPYWKRAHNDWRFRIGVAMMFAAMIIYVATNCFAGWSFGRPPPLTPGAVVK